MKIKINPDGTAIMIYTEDIDIAALGNVQSIIRASIIEPTDGNRWVPDMGPVGGPVLGAFDKRSDALAAEANWIEENILEGQNRE